MSDQSQNYETFIEGETIDLVIPNENAIDRDGWHRWFNDPRVTRYSDYGLYPNTPERQRAYLRDLTQPESRRLALLIRPCGESAVVGVASLSSIHPIHRSAETAVLIGNHSTSAGALFWGLEAKARLVIHGFEVMGLERIGGAQAMPLADWQRYQVLFGFRPEGIKRRAYRRGYQVFDSILSSCTVEDYLRVKEARQGEYWPGKTRLLELMRKLPKESIAEKVAKAIDIAVAEYTRNVDIQ